MGLVTRRRFVTCAAVTAAASWAAARSRVTRLAEAPVVTDQEREAMERLVDAFRRAHDVPGLSAAFARGGHLLYAQGFGFADVGRRVPITPGHLFRIASVSKPITSYAIFGLVERGRLALGDTVFGPAGILGTMYGRSPHGPDIDRITIEHLLTHTCGGWPNDADDPMGQRPELTHADLISWVLDSVPLVTRPGAHFAYSNFGYCVLGRVIEKITGLVYAQYLQEAVLGRCDIRDMVIAGNRVAERAPNEVEYFGERGENPYAINVRRMDSHGGWLATARDLVRFATYVDGFVVPRDILSSDTIRTMTTPSPLNEGYARGWSVNEHGTWWHDGSLPGTLSIMVRTSTGLCWAALANTRRLRSQMGAALDELMWDLSRVPGSWGHFERPPERATSNGIDANGTI